MAIVIHFEQIPNQNGLECTFCIVLIIHVWRVSGLSSLQFVNLNSSRNLFVLGFSIFFALVSTHGPFHLANTEGDC